MLDLNPPLVGAGPYGPTNNIKYYFSGTNIWIDLRPVSKFLYICWDIIWQKIDQNFAPKNDPTMTAYDPHFLLQNLFLL